MIRDTLLYVTVPSCLVALFVWFGPMPIRHRYVLKKYVSVFYLAFVFEVALILIVRLGDRELGTIMENEQSIRTGILLFIYKAPVRILEVVPAAGMMAAFFTIGSLTRANELTALRSIGENLYRLVLPILAFSFVTSLITVAFVDRVVGPANQRAAELDNTRPYAAEQHIIFREASGAFCLIQSLDFQGSKAYRLTFYELKGGVLAREIYAATAEWDPGMWRLRNGWIRTYDENGSRPGAFETFDQLDRPLDADLKVLIASASNPEEMDFGELRRVISFKHRAGLIARREIVRMHHNIAYPFALLIGTMLSLPLSMQFGRHAIAIGFPATMLMSFLYWGMAIATFEAMGETGRIPPHIAPWAANILFGVIALVLFRGVRR